MNSSFTLSSPYGEIRYRDFWTRLFLCILAAHIMSHYSSSDRILEAIFTVSYLRSFIASFIMAFITSGYIKYVTKKLDLRYHWKLDTGKRVFWQSLLGAIIPCGLVLFMVAIYFAIFGLNILETGYIKKDYIVAVLMVVILNLYYFGLGLYHQLNIPAAKALDGSLLTAVISRDDAQMAEVSGRSDDQETNGSATYLEIVIIDTPTKSIPIKTADIAYIYILEGTVYIRTREMETMAESYMVTGKLKDLEAKLNPKDFFRINRKMIVHFDACTHFSAFNSKTLLLTLSPVPYPEEAKIPDEHARLCLVSEDRVAPFREWMMR